MVLHTGKVGHPSDHPCQVAMVDWQPQVSLMSMPARAHNGGPAPAPGPPASLQMLQMLPVLAALLSAQSCRADPVHTTDRQHGLGWSQSSHSISHSPLCLRHLKACLAPKRGLSGFCGVVFLPTPTSWRAGSHKSRTWCLSDRSSLSWHCGWWWRGHSMVVLGTGKCWQWGGGSLQSGFLSCTATTSQIKVLSGGAAATPSPGCAEEPKHGTQPWHTGCRWEPARTGAGCSRCSLPLCSASAACHQPPSQ